MILLRFVDFSKYPPMPYLASIVKANDPKLFAVIKVETSYT